ncbi:DUF4419 domain-containing protein [Kibdelosporangium aridum]|uniref:DUF4419 domain-containing protein n=1 Tax=Kibdelosporangium aridum TaxID=2030 RepID=UPI000527BF8E
MAATRRGRWSCPTACIRGIPSITLTGTVEDWRKIGGRVDHLEKFGLEKWCRSLWPIADQFVRAASGTVEPENNSSYDGPNPLLDLPITQPENDSTTEHGIRSDNAPATLSKVVIHVQKRDNHAVALHADPVGVAQDDDFVWRPIVGWHLTRASVEMDDVID